jgi:hypothetical protein
LEQIYYVDRLASVYLEKKNWTQACKILNCALALFEQECERILNLSENEKLNNSPIHETAFYRDIVRRLEAIETQFLMETQQQQFQTAESDESHVPSNGSYIRECRQELLRARLECKAMFQRGIYVKWMEREAQSQSTGDAQGIEKKKEELIAVDEVKLQQDSIGMHAIFSLLMFISHSFSRNSIIQAID